MFLAPRERSTGRRAEILQVGIEVAARDRYELLGLVCALVGLESEIGKRDGVVRCNNHQQRRGGNSRNPDAGLVHPREPRRSHRHEVFPSCAGAKRLEVEIDGVFRAICRRGAVIRATIAWRRGGSPRAWPRSSSFNAASSAATASGATWRKPCSYPLIVGTCATTQPMRLSVAPRTSA